jgi:Protein of unknown function (DUF1571)
MADLRLGLITALVVSAGCAQLQRTSARVTRLTGQLKGLAAPEPVLAPQIQEPSGYILANSTEPPEGAVRALGAPTNRQPDSLDLPAQSTAHAQPTEEPPAIPEALPAVETARPDPMGEIEQVINRAQETLDATSTYRVQMTRQERVDDKLLDQEVVRLNIRRSPLGVLLEWPSGPNEGREVLFSEQECGGLMHVKLAGKIPVPPLKIKPTSSVAMQKSRHPINEAGIDPILNDLRSHLAAAKAGDATAGDLQLLSAEGGQPVISREAPDGELWTVEFDPETSLPFNVRRLDAAGQLVEEYRFEDFEPNPADLGTPEAFDPTLRWPSGGGFLSRIAKAAEGGVAQPPDSSQAP